MCSLGRLSPSLRSSTDNPPLRYQARALPPTSRSLTIRCKSFQVPFLCLRSILGIVESVVKGFGEDSLADHGLPCQIWHEYTRKGIQRASKQQRGQGCPFLNLSS